MRMFRSSLKNDKKRHRKTIKLLIGDYKYEKNTFFYF